MSKEQNGGNMIGKFMIDTSEYNSRISNKKDDSIGVFKNEYVPYGKGQAMVQQNGVIAEMGIPKVVSFVSGASKHIIPTPLDFYNMHHFKGVTQVGSTIVTRNQVESLVIGGETQVGPFLSDCRSNEEIYMVVSAKIEKEDPVTKKTITIQYKDGWKELITSNSWKGATGLVGFGFVSKKELLQIYKSSSLEPSRWTDLCAKLGINNTSTPKQAFDALIPALMLNPDTISKEDDYMIYLLYKCAKKDVLDFITQEILTGKKYRKCWVSMILTGHTDLIEDTTARNILETKYANYVRDKSALIGKIVPAKNRFKNFMAPWRVGETRYESKIGENKMAIIYS